MTDKLPDRCLDQLFRDARTHNAWTERDIPDALLHDLVDLAKLGPTSANCSPARFLFVKSRAAKEQENRSVGRLVRHGERAISKNDPPGDFGGGLAPDLYAQVYTTSVRGPSQPTISSPCAGKSPRTRL